MPKDTATAAGWLLLLLEEEVVVPLPGPDGCEGVWRVWPARGRQWEGGHGVSLELRPERWTAAQCD